MKNLSCSVYLWTIIILLPLTSACSRTAPAVNLSSSDVKDVSPSPSASDSSPSPIRSDVNDVSPAPSAPDQAPSPPPLDINDVSFLWPVPQTKADVDALISLNDEAADGKIFPDELFGKLIDEA